MGSHDFLYKFSYYLTSIAFTQFPTNNMTPLPQRINHKPFPLHSTLYFTQNYYLHLRDLQHRHNTLKQKTTHSFMTYYTANIHAMC
jgi:hypothetical protein